MPRSLRLDFEPEILLPDVRGPEREANNVIGNKYRAKVRPVDYRPIIDGWTNIFDRTEETFNFIRRTGGHVDEGLVFFMMRHCAMASASGTAIATCLSFAISLSPRLGLNIHC
jgi:hypothetical protein